MNSQNSANGALALKSNVAGLKPALTLVRDKYPAKAFILAQYDNNKGRTFEKAVAEANERKVIIASNPLIDPRLTGEEKLYKGETEIYPLWTGTLVIYTKPGEKLGAEVAYTDSETKNTYLFKIPKDYQSATNCVLAINHGFDEKGNPVFALEQDGKKQFVVTVSDENKLTLIENFPAGDGWYRTERGFLLPVGEGANSNNSDTRRLWRVEKYVGLLARGYGLNDYDGRRYVYARLRPSDRLGVLAFEASPEGAAAEKPAPKLVVGEDKTSPVGGLKALEAGAREALDELAKTADERLVQPIRAYFDAVTKA